MIIVFDNDCGYWSCESENSEEGDRMCDEYTERYGEPGGYRDVVDIMVGAGFNAEWC